MPISVVLVGISNRARVFMSEVLVYGVPSLISMMPLILMMRPLLPTLAFSAFFSSAAVLTV